MNIRRLESNDEPVVRALIQAGLRERFDWIVPSFAWIIAKIPFTSSLPSFA